MNSLLEVTLQLPLGCQTLHHIGPIQDLGNINVEMVTGINTSVAYSINILQ